MNKKLLRELEQKDAARMIEWMHDDYINKWYKYPFAEMTLNKAESFIKSSNDNENTRHFAVTNENDEYCGTISLKNIDKDNSNAEMAIVLRKECHGTGMAKKATDELFEIAFNEYNLHKVYLNVLDDNKRAISFYEKIGMNQEGISKESVLINGVYRDLAWFGIIDKEYKNAAK